MFHLYTSGDHTTRMRPGDKWIEVDMLPKGIWEAIADRYDTLDLDDIVVSDSCYAYEGFDAIWDEITQFAELFPTVDETITP